MYNSVDKFEKPREILKYSDSAICEMPNIQLDFLCGLIRDNQPRKLLEVGVAEGGTTAVILNCLQMVCPDCEMYSVDLNERLYRDENYKTGYVLTILSSYLKNLDKHHLITGGILPDYICEIGSDIDFVILDTVHRLPGEILDFLCVLPFLRENAVVVLHDITMGTSFSAGINDSICNGVLFAVVSGKKYWELDRPGYMGISNIAAFQVTTETKKNIIDVFGSLVLPWAYLPIDDEWDKYAKLVRMKYDKECNEMFEMAMFRNKLSRTLQEKKMDL